jgi:hypothetical protein
VAGGLTLLTACQTADPAEEASLTPSVIADDARWSEMYYQCMLDQGVPVTRHEDGSVGFNSSGDDEAWQSFEAASQACNQKMIDLGLVTASQPLSREDMQNIYPLYIEFFDCLVDQGMDTGPMQTEDQILEQGGYTYPGVGDEPAYTVCHDKQEAVDKALFAATNQ